MTNLEILENIQNLLFYISETLVDENKLYTSKETAIKEIREYCDKYNVTWGELQQIKNILEAWEVVKKCLCIDTDSWDEYSDSFDYIRFTVASIHPLLGFSRQEIESIKKTLEEIKSENSRKN